jgi:hypothetical protein
LLKALASTIYLRTAKQTDDEANGRSEMVLEKHDIQTTAAGSSSNACR